MTSAHRSSTWICGIGAVISPPAKIAIALTVRAARRWIEVGGPQLGAAIAFYSMFALAPLLIFAIAIAGVVFGQEAARGQIVGQIESLVGTSVAVEIESMIKSAWQHPYSGWASLLGAGTLLVGASSVFVILRNALNAIGKAGPAESLVGAFLRARLVGFALVLGFGFLSITSLLVSASLAAFRAYIFGFQPSLGGLLSAVDAIVSTVVLSVAFAALLRWLPGTAPSGKAVWIGASTSALLFLIGKFFIGVYLTRVDIASAYGAAGSFVVIMLWVYYSAQILLFGGALAAVLDERRIEVQIR